MNRNIKTIIFNTAKIAGAAILSIILATMLQLEFSVAAGIITILTIQPTKRETLQTALGRFYAFLVALFIASISFPLLNYSLLSFMVYLLLFIGTCQIYGWYSSMAMNSVLISHFLTFKTMDYDAVSNEITLFVLGVTIGIIANLHLHKKSGYIYRLQEETDEQIKEILKKMSQRILDSDVSDYNERSFQKLNSSILKSQTIAIQNYKNQLNNKDTYDVDYIKMRDEQYHVLYEMYKSVRTLETTPLTAKMVSDLLLEISENYHRNNTGEELLSHFQVIRNEMKNKPLPVERKEFEDRARLFILLNYIEEFLTLKKDFMEKYQQMDIF